MIYIFRVYFVRLRFLWASLLSPTPFRRHSTQLEPLVISAAVMQLLEKADHLLSPSTIITLNVGTPAADSLKDFSIISSLFSDHGKKRSHIWIHFQLNVSELLNRDQSGAPRLPGACQWVLNKCLCSDGSIGGENRFLCRKAQFFFWPNTGRETVLPD